MSAALLQALMGSQYSAGSDPFGVAAKSIGEVAPRMINPYASPGANVATALGASLLTGLLGAYAQNRTDEKNRDLYSSMGALLKPGADREAAVAANPRLATLAGALGAQDLENQQNLAIKGQELFMTKQAERGQFAGADGTMQQAFDPNQDAANKASAVKGAELRTEQSIGGISPKDARSLESHYTDALTTGQVAQKVQEGNTQASNVLMALNQKDPLAAATALYGFIKTLDDGTVRESETGMFSNAGGPLGVLAQTYNKIMQKGILTDEARQSMLELVPKLAQNRYASYESLKGSTLDAAKSQGANPANIGFIKPFVFQPAPTQVTAPDGRVVEIVE